MTDCLTYSKAEAADAIGISERLVQKEIQAGRMPAVHIGTSVRIPKSALATWLDEQALASLKEQAVADYLSGRNEPTVIGLGSRRKPRDSGQKSRAAIAVNDHSSVME